jgi:hypothetical protein
MREIKFRGKVLEGGWMYVTPESGSWEQFWALVDKETVGEFTGCYDNTLWERATPQEQQRWLKHHTRAEWKGVEVYEGDVLYWRGFMGEVYWDQEFAAWRARRIGSLGGLTDLEITGNIHDKQEQEK